jgi:hypothetical protein
VDFVFWGRFGNCVLCCKYFGEDLGIMFFVSILGEVLGSLGFCK